MMGFAVVVGAALVKPTFSGVPWANPVLGFITGFSLTAASMAINDYFDRTIDAVNEPYRPIPSGLVKPKQALAYATILTAIGLVAAGLTSIYCFFLAIIAWIIFVTYTVAGKRSGLPGNFLVSACVAIPLIYGNFIVVNGFELNVSIFVLIIFLSNTGREITKGIADIKGDETQNVKTLAVRFGEKNAAISAAAFYLLAVMFTPLPWIMKVVSFWFIPLVAITDVGLVISTFMLLQNHSPANARKVKRIVLWWLAIGLIAFVVGAVG
jgi:geranylgeranylglycerol-phosphate geranylgeranyltransferase